jgi:hypothetical protein
MRLTPRGWAVVGLTAFSLGFFSIPMNCSSLPAWWPHRHR